MLRKIRSVGLLSLAFGLLIQSATLAQSPQAPALATPEQAQAAEDLRFVILSQEAHAPEFRLESPDGKIISLEDYKGKTVLLNFWSTHCHACTIERPSMNAAYEKFKEKGFVVLGVSLDHGPNAVVKNYAQKHNMNFPIGIDRSTQAALQFGIRATPTSFLILPSGRVLGGVMGARNWDSPEAQRLLRSVL